jgi:hypothetical protein
VLEDYAIDHWNMHHMEVATGTMANPMGITKLSLPRTDYTAVIFTARYESYLDFSVELHPRATMASPATLRCARCTARVRGETLPLPLLLLALGVGLGMDRACMVPVLGPLRLGAWGSHLFSYRPCASVRHVRKWQRLLPHAPPPAPGHRLP